MTGLVLLVAAGAIGTIDLILKLRLWPLETQLLPPSLDPLAPPGPLTSTKSPSAHTFLSPENTTSDQETLALIVAASLAAGEMQRAL